ncbi:MAG: hypothetical protein EP307_00910 [Rhodobacteraceae bacterium]|nr:MAG: hypothetical protein EP307_00910 [Paracoccaceae bacterium]
MALGAVLLSPVRPAEAQAPMTAAEFEAYTTGKTLFYGVNGQIYGAERYLPDRRVEWSFLDGECKEGVWYEEAGNICFAYEDWGVPQCWRFTQTPGGLIAQFQGDDGDTNLYEAQETGEELQCLGPKIGV